MRAIDAFVELRAFGRPVLTTEDAALRMRTTLSAATRTLQCLAARGLIARLRHGLWAVDPSMDPLVLPEYLTAPLPSYVSFQSALYFHGLISQIPQVIYVASLARTRRVTTTFATYSIHQLAPELFGGYETTEANVKMGTPEKALVDLLYLAAARSRLFAALPEIELPATFRLRECRRWICKIPAEYRRTMVTRRLNALLANARD
jgi:predicted transcriptional regulator of viral defense system